MRGEFQQAGLQLMQIMSGADSASRENARLVANSAAKVNGKAYHRGIRYHGTIPIPYPRPSE